MKNNFRLSVLAMLSAVAVTFTSCLGDDDDNTQYIYGTGTALTATSINLDNGLTITSSGMGITTGERYYIMAQCTQSEYEAAFDKLQSGGQATLVSDYVSGGKFIWGELMEEENMTEEEEPTSTEVTSLNWFSYGSFGNGYMNFTVTGNYFVRTENGTATIMDPECKLLWNYDASARKLSMTFVYNSRRDECVEEDGTLKDGYSAYSGQELPVTVNVTDIYYTLTSNGLSESDNVNLSIRYMNNGTVNSSSELTGSFGTSTNYLTVSAFRTTYGLYY